MMEIYRITNNINGMVYIGQTRRTVAERVKQHIYQQSKIGKAMTKYGTENFSVDVIDRAETQEELDALERFWIAFYNTRENGYNTLIGGKPTKKEFRMLSQFSNSAPKKKRPRETGRADSKADHYSLILEKRKKRVYRHIRCIAKGERPKPQIDDVSLYEVYAENFGCKRFPLPKGGALTQNQRVYIKNALIEKLYGIKNCIYKSPLWWMKYFGEVI